MGQTTPAIGIYIPSAGEDGYDQSFAAGMFNIDQHDHSGGPNKGLPIATEGLGDASVTFDKLNPNVVDPTTGIGTSGTFPNQLVLLDPIKSIFQLAPAGVGILTLNGNNAAVRTLTNSATINWTGGNGTANPVANLVVPVTVPNGGTGITTTTPYAPILAGTTATGAFQQPASAGNVGEVYTSQGAGAPGVFAPLGGLGQIQYANVTLTAAQVRALNVTPIQIVPAPGAGKVLVPLFCYALLNSDGTPFALASGTTFIALGYNTVTTACTFANSAFITTTTDTYWWATQSTNAAGAVKTSAQNIPLNLFVGGFSTNYTGGGNSTISFVLSYLTITL